MIIYELPSVQVHLLLWYVFSQLILLSFYFSVYVYVHMYLPTS